MPEVRIIDNQTEVINQNVPVSKSEVEYLLHKYGFKTTNYVEQPTQSPLTFEEMISQEEEKRKAEQHRLNLIKNGPKSITFDQSKVSTVETKWSDVELGDSKIGIKIDIVSDMKF